MVSTGEMEARLEILERRFEGWLTIRENMEFFLEGHCRERLEAQTSRRIDGLNASQFTYAEGYAQ
jgi:hypothetical protein